MIDDDRDEAPARELDEVLSRFNKLTSSQQAVVLARLAFELTIAARDTYIPGSDGIRYPERLRALNEIQHRITGRLVDIIARAWLDGRQ